LGTGGAFLAALYVVIPTQSRCLPLVTTRKSLCACITVFGRLPGAFVPCLIAACKARVSIPRSAFRRCRCLVRISSIALVAVAT
jgi:hypothetical protein